MSLTRKISFPLLSPVFIFIFIVCSSDVWRHIHAVIFSPFSYPKNPTSLWKHKLITHHITKQCDISQLTPFPIAPNLFIAKKSTASLTSFVAPLYKRRQHITVPVRPFPAKQWKIATFVSFFERKVKAFSQTERISKRGGASWSAQWERATLLLNLLRS